MTPCFDTQREQNHNVNQLKSFKCSVYAPFSFFFQIISCPVIVLLLILNTTTTIVWVSPQSFIVSLLLAFVSQNLPSFTDPHTDPRVFELCYVCVMFCFCRISVVSLSLLLFLYFTNILLQWNHVSNHVCQVRK